MLALRLRGRDPDAVRASAESLDWLDICRRSTHLDGVAAASDDATAVVKQLDAVSGSPPNVPMRPHDAQRRICPGLNREAPGRMRHEAPRQQGAMTQGVSLGVNQGRSGWRSDRHLGAAHL